jgi:hypothetical protein
LPSQISAVGAPATVSHFVFETDLPVSSHISLPVLEHSPTPTVQDAPRLKPSSTRLLQLSSTPLHVSAAGVFALHAPKAPFAQVWIPVHVP